MKKYFLCGFLLATLSPLNAWADSEKCVSLDMLFKTELAKLGGNKWTAFQLKKDGQAWYLAFLEIPGKPSQKANWAIYSRLSNDRPDMYCQIGNGDTIENLMSLDQTNFTEKYGMPGSGNPRCGLANDPLEGVKVRAWASRELGSSMILSLANKEASPWTLLLSKKDGFWILLNKENAGSTCYYDRGELSDIKELSGSK